MSLQIIDTVNIPSVSAPPLKGFGLLYNAYAYAHANFAPANWRVPVLNDWILFNHFVYYATLIRSQRNYPAFPTGWVGGGGTNSHLFSLLPSGYRLPNGNFMDANNYAMVAGNGGSGLQCSASNMTRISFVNNFGVSVRLIMIDSSGWVESDRLTDIDGNIYETVKIGTQVWITSNWKCTKLNESTPMVENTGNSYDWMNAVIPTYCSYNCLAIKEE